MLRLIINYILLLNLSFFSYAQQNSYQIKTVAFYNLENLFDTINNTSKNDEASPIMALKFNRSKVYKDKIRKLSLILPKIGTSDKIKNAPVIIGVVEIENDTVLHDLTNAIREREIDYKFIHYDSPDERGIDVALLYQKEFFTPTRHKKYPLFIYDEDRERVYTRDQLLVSGRLDDEKVHFIVNHWPSKRGGTKSIPFREEAAKLTKKIIQDIKRLEPNAKIIIMGDFNDDPIEPSIKKILKTEASISATDIHKLYNPFEKMFQKGLNTLGYRDNINLFDQIIITGTFLNQHYKTYQFYKAGIFNPKHLSCQNGRYKGYPLRSFSSGKYTGGYSDHYPVYIHLLRKIK